MGLHSRPGSERAGALTGSCARRRSNSCELSALHDYCVNLVEDINSKCAVATPAASRGEWSRTVHRVWHDAKLTVQGVTER